MKMPHTKIEGLFLLALAASLFWYPYSLSQPGRADHKILVATNKLQDGTFDRTVVLVLHHNGFSSFGLVLNKPASNSEELRSGGPVRPDIYHTLHSLDVSETATVPFPSLRMGYTQGAGFVRNKMQPQEHISFKGFSGWGLAQLSRELRNGYWKVIDFDRDLVFHTDPQTMWDTAVRRVKSQEYVVVLNKE